MTAQFCSDVQLRVLVLRELVLRVSNAIVLAICRREKSNADLGSQSTTRVVFVSASGCREKLTAACCRPMPLLSIRVQRSNGHERANGRWTKSICSGNFSGWVAKTHFFSLSLVHLHNRKLKPSWKYIFYGLIWKDKILCVTNPCFVWVLSFSLP